MAKLKTAFFCNNCGAEFPKWFGKCNACGQWNTCTEEVVEAKKTAKPSNLHGVTDAKPQLVSEITFSEINRLDMCNGEFNRVLGGGMVPGAVVLIGGEPGIGKSTLILQIALGLKNFKTLYVSGEESKQQIKLRAQRMGTDHDQCYVLAETSLENILKHINEVNPDIVVIDSIQTCQTERIEASAGSVSQIKECAAQILRMAKETQRPVILIGHINKDGNIAGPKVLEHIVDTVLQFEGDQNYMYRILRAAKNRFGSTSEIGIFEMHSGGLREVSNPSELLLSHRDQDFSGVAISASIEGVRPFLIEVQALVSSAAYSVPQRSCTGFDMRRLSMLLAVLEKRAGFRLAVKDVFLNIAGGIKVDDPAIDLAVISAILSSDLNIAIEKDICFAGEVGLTGEIRPVNRIEQRISEAHKLGFKQIFISKYNTKGIDLTKLDIEVHYVSKVEEVFKKMFK